VRREKLYSPEIRPEKVRELYQLKLKTGRKMTELVDEALGQYLARELKGGEKQTK
jgi:hypothetical protein